MKEENMGESDGGQKGGNFIFYFWIVLLVFTLYF
jgi:hypothetical protein